MWLQHGNERFVLFIKYNMTSQYLRKPYGRSWTSAMIGRRDPSASNLAALAWTRSVCPQGLHRFSFPHHLSSIIHHPPYSIRAHHPRGLKKTSRYHVIGCFTEQVPLPSFSNPRNEPDKRNENETLLASIQLKLSILSSIFESSIALRPSRIAVSPIGVNLIVENFRER